MEAKYPFVNVNLLGHDSNAMAIMGSVTQGLKDAARRGDMTREESKDAIAEYRKQAMSGDYDNLIRVTMATVSTDDEDDD